MSTVDKREKRVAGIADTYWAFQAVTLTFMSAKWVGFQAVMYKTATLELRPMSHLQFYHATLQCNFITQKNRLCDTTCCTTV